MSASPSPFSRPSLVTNLVTRLRAAGCVFAEDEARLLIAAAQTPADLAAMMDRRVAGMPLEHVLGWAEFCGLRIAVDPGVFVPRRRTEFLVRQAVAIARQAGGIARQAAAFDPTVPLARHRTARHRTARHRTARHRTARHRTVVLDLCCGSGAVGAALAAALGAADLYATDIDRAAVRCARRNVTAAGGQVYEGDLYAPLPTTLMGGVDLIVANTPYVPTREIVLLPAEARTHEPQVALDGGADGLDVVRRLTEEAPQWLAPGGHLLVETSERQASQAVEAAARSGLISRVARSGKLRATVVVATRPVSPQQP